MVLHALGNEYLCIEKMKFPRVVMEILFEKYHCFLPLKIGFCNNTGNEKKRLPLRKRFWNNRRKKLLFIGKENIEL